MNGGPPSPVAGQADSVTSPTSRGIKGFVQRKKEARATKKHRQNLERDSVDPVQRAAQRVKRKSRFTTEREARPLFLVVVNGL